MLSMFSIERIVGIWTSAILGPLHLRLGRPADHPAGRRVAHAEHGHTPRHVFQDPDRQPRRDRLPRHQDREAHGHRDRRGVLRGRPRRAARRAGRRGGLHRCGTEPGVVPRRRQDHRRLQGDRCRGRPSGIRFPVRERRVRASGRSRGIVFIGPKHASIAAMGDKIESKKLAARREGQHDPGLQRGDRHRRACGRDRARASATR